MSEYRPTQIDPGVNVSNRSPLKEFFTLLVGLTGVVLIAYAVLGFSVDIVADNISVDTETSLLGFVGNMPGNDQSEENDIINAMQARIDRVFKLLPASFMEDLPAYDYKLTVVDEDIINAVSLPGGRMLFYRGLLEKTKTDKELLFVIGHELGHFINRDHLRGLGRGLVFAIVSGLVVGPDGGLTTIFSGIETTLLARHSQKQEYAADDWGLKAYKSVYNTTEGATNFMKTMESMSKKRKLKRWSQLLASHPHASDRIKRIEKRSKKLNQGIR